MNKPPLYIGGAEVYSFLILNHNHQKTGNTQHFIGGELLEEFYGLVICKYDNDSGFYLFYCNENWEEYTDTYHDSIEDAKDQGEFEFAGTWIDLKK